MYDIDPTPLGTGDVSVPEGRPDSEAAALADHMLAGRLVAPGRVEVIQAPVPAVGEGGALVRMRRAAICGSDLHAVYDGMAQVPLPAVPGYPGHEGVGEIVEARAAGFAPGDRVLTVPTGGGDQALGFAEYQSLATSQLVRLPDGPGLEHLVMAQQLGTVIYAMKRFWPAGDAAGLTAVVIGAGPAGLFFVQLLRQRGFGQILVSDIEPSRLEIARTLGADHALCPPSESIVDATMAQTRGASAALVIETAGYDATRAEAVDCAGYQATLGLYGYPEHFGMAPFPFYRVFRKALRIEVSVGAQSEPGLASFVEAVDKVATGAVESDYLQSCSFPLRSLALAFETARARSHPKVQVTM
jgi:L-iditol 2-dehydrogenase